MNFDFLKENTALLVSDFANRRYLTGFPSSYGFVLKLINKTFLFVDGRYITAAKNTVSDEIETICIKDLFLQINEILKQNKISKLFVEDTVSVAEFNNFKEKFCCEVEPSKEIVSVLQKSRSVKTDSEILNIIKAQEIAEKAFTEILNYIKVGVSEKQIANQLDFFMRDYNSEGIAFETICVSGKNSALPHGVPSEKLVENGDFITLDFGAVYNGYRSDMTRTIAVSYATDEMQNVYNTVLKAQNSAIEEIKSGITAAFVDAATRNIIKDNGYGDYFTHSTGHGVGIEIHEYPNVSFKNNDLLLENQIITVEPGIYLPEKFGVRIEDMVLVKNNSHQNLTKVAKTLIIL